MYRYGRHRTNLNALERLIFCRIRTFMAVANQFTDQIPAYSISSDGSPFQQHFSQPQSAKSDQEHGQVMPFDKMRNGVCFLMQPQPQCPNAERREQCSTAGEPVM